MSTINNPKDIAAKLAELQNSKTEFERQTILFNLEANMLRALNFDGALQNGDPERHLLALEQYSYLLTRSVILFNYYEGKDGRGIFCEEIVLDAAFKCAMTMGPLLDAIVSRRLYQMMNPHQIGRMKVVSDIFYAQIQVLNRCVSNDQFVAPIQNDRTGATWLPDEVPLQFQLAFLFYFGFVTQALMHCLQQVNAMYYDLDRFNECQKAMNYHVFNKYKVYSFARCLVLGRPINQGHISLLQTWHKCAKEFNAHLQEIARCAEMYSKLAIDTMEEWFKEGKYPDPLPRPNVGVEWLKFIGIMLGFFIAIGVFMFLIVYLIHLINR